MLHAFECSKVGSKHEVCQDYSMSKRLSDGIISAIADGVGSAKNSDKGSYIAVNTVVDSFLSGYAKVTNVYDAVALVKKCYTDAYNAINNFADSKNNDIYSYDTTLSMVVLTDKFAVWGHCGDGAIFKIMPSGYMTKITIEQVGDFLGNVYPLLAGEKYWNFGICDKDALEYILVTDGVLEFMNRINSDYENRFNYINIAQLEKRKYDKLACDLYISKLLDHKFVKAVTNDDKTYAVIINDEYKINSLKSVVFCHESEIVLDFTNKSYFIQPIDMLNPNINYSIYEEKDSKLKSAIAYIDDFIECQLFYPIRETEIVLDINSGIKNAIIISNHIISRLLNNLRKFENIDAGAVEYSKKVTETNMQNKNNEINYGKDLKINETDKCIIAIMDDFQDITCTISMFKDFFDIKFNIPNIRNLDMELQAQSYMYNIAYYLVKGMLFLKKNLKDIPNPQKNYIIKLKCEVNKNE